jgi:hypothetical protein
LKIAQFLHPHISAISEQILFLSQFLFTIVIFFSLSVEIKIKEKSLSWWLVIKVIE